MDTKQTTEIETNEVYLELTGEIVPISKRDGKWIMDDAAYGIASRVDSETYGRFCRILMSRINSGMTEGKVGIVNWHFC